MPILENGAVKKIFLFLCVLAVIAGFWVWRSLAPVDSGNQQMTLLKVESGESLGQIAAKLEQQHLVRSALACKLAARITGVAGVLKAGAFIIRPSDSCLAILSILVGGKSQTVSVTIPEGSTLADIDRLLANKGLGETGAILDCAFHCDFSSFDFLPVKAAGSRELGYGSRLEGYLFPETYFVSVAEYQPKFFLERLLGTFRKRIIDPYGTKVTESKRSLHDLVIMASLVEKESAEGDERPIVASILWKRLASRVPLGVDAVTRYVLGKRTEALTKTDLEIDSPYNTRKHTGLPPSPIANPGASAFVAALQPTETGYWYYLHDSHGTIHYAVTNEEHNRNRALYLR